MAENYKIFLQKLLMNIFHICLVNSKMTSNKQIEFFKLFGIKSRLHTKPTAFGMGCKSTPCYLLISTKATAKATACTAMMSATVKPHCPCA